jgi:hypothetical protein
MSSPPTPPAPDPHPTTPIGAASSLGHGLIRVLPPAFLLLILMNCLFLGVIAWVFNHAAETRNVLLTKIVERCLVEHHPQ